MSSQRRIDSSRANGARSHAAGLAHGPTARQLVLGNESEEEFDALREAYLAEYQPQARRWRHNRVPALQPALLDTKMERQEPNIRPKFEICATGTRIAIAFRAAGPSS